jgi:hypothetical protein
MGHVAANTVHPYSTDGKRDNRPSRADGYIVPKKLLLMRYEILNSIPLYRIEIIKHKNAQY